MIALNETLPLQSAEAIDNVHLQQMQREFKQRALEATKKDVGLDLEKVQ